MRTTILVLALFLGLQTYAQKGATDPRLSDRFSALQISTMDESRIAYWTYYLDHSYTIMDVPVEKATQLGELEVIDISSDDFHGFSLILDSYHKEGAYLKFKDEGKMVAIKPIKQFVEEFNTHYQATK